MTRCALAMSVSLLMAGCGVGEGTGSTPPWAQPPTPVAPAVNSPATADTAGATDATVVERIPPYKVKFETTKGDVVIAVQPAWALRGAKRFKELVESGYYDDNRIFRVVPGFVVQFGMHGDPEVYAKWDQNTIKDDRVKVTNRKGTVTFATSGPNSRTTQIFINLSDNPNLDTMAGSFAPFAEVVEGMDVVESFNSQYEEAASKMQGEIASGGNAFLDKRFPGLDTIVKATIIDESPATDADATDAAPADPAPAADPDPATEAETPSEPSDEPPAAESDSPSDPPAEEPAPEDAPPSDEEPATDDAPAAEDAETNQPAAAE